jgi:hypothetical protein
MQSIIIYIYIYIYICTQSILILNECRHAYHALWGVGAYNVMIPCNEGIYKLYPGPNINNLIKFNGVLLGIIAFLLWIMSGRPSILNNFGYACHDTFAVEACVHHDMRGWRLLKYHITLYYMLLYVIKIYLKYSYYITIYIYISLFLYSINWTMLVMIPQGWHDPSGGRLAHIMS